MFFPLEYDKKEHILFEQNRNATKNICLEIV